jgi:hypothetical protein
MRRPLLLLLLGLLFPAPLRSQEAPDPEGLEFFEKKIRPVLVDRCYSCHSAQAQKLKGGLLLDTRSGIRKGGETGPAVVPGDLEKSLLVKALRYDDPDLKMPPKGRLAADVVRDVEAWVKRGAPDPREGGSGAAGPKTRVIKLSEERLHWAYLPLKHPAPPGVKNGAWVRTPVDRFILSRLEERGIAPRPPADLRRLIRRATFDLTGLPPTPEEVEAFVQDPDPQAYDRLIDRLLASPAFGERWARHWLDVARFAESHGFEQDYDREGAYPYRDFVIQAFNQDMPFDQFVRWQIAGDELAPQEPLAWMATGFLGAGAFPTQLTEAEFESARYDELDSMVSTTGSAMLGLSVGCARCHDHKYDPIPTQDYYRLASTFTTTIRSQTDLELDPEASRKALLAWEKEHAQLVAELEKFDREELPGRASSWAAGRPWESMPAAPWTVLSLAETRSQGGAVFVPQPDGSVLLSGPNPDRDVWTITARTALVGLTAVRLFALKDASLKKGGPGRADNGNFALTELRVWAEPAQGSGKREPVKLVTAKATFEQNKSNLAAAAAIDRNPNTGWAVDPEVGKDHALVLEFDRPVGFPGGTRLGFELEFNLNVRHALGRLRLEVSREPLPAGLGGESRPESSELLLLELRKTGARPDLVEALYRQVDPAYLALSQKVKEHLARKPSGLLTRVLVTSDGLKPLKHHADERGFPHFYKETYQLARGDVNRKQGIAKPGFLEALMRGSEGESRWSSAAPPGARSPHRRAALARWLTDVEAGAGNLLARVISNRLWLHHFGRGIVATPNDFGRQGEPPTHPELLEWLSSELVRGGWKLKPLHRWIMTSTVYLEDSKTLPETVAADPDDRLLSRRPHGRLEGEAIRDSMLALGGLLDRRLYGPGTLDENMTRRSLYFFIKRSRLIPSLTVFDQPEPLVSIGSRPTTTIAPQALLFMNSPQVRRCAEGMARRLPAASFERAVEEAYRKALGRPPDPFEAEASLSFLRRRTSDFPEANGRLRALTDFCQALFCLNEFVYID